jgi:hypothetical protein
MCCRMACEISTVHIDANSESTLLTDLMKHLEILWRDLDTLFGSSATDDLSRPTGSARIIADVAMHLARFDREVIVTGLEREAETRWRVPPIELDHQSRIPATLQACLGQMQSMRQAIRAIVASLSDADLVRPIWLAIQDCGWVRLQDGLEACRWHTWSRYMEVGLRLKRDVPPSDPAITYAALNFILHFWLPCIIDRRAANQIELQIEWTFTGPGGGQWTMNIAEGQAVVHDGQSPNFDLAFTQSPESFVKTIHRLHDPMMAMLTGEIRVQGFERMGDFDRLFPDLPFGLPTQIPP